jgi:diacylglycerol kinase (ATP)
MGPIYYEYGSLILTYADADIAVKAFYMLRESSYDDKNLLVLVLPNISASNLSIGVRVRDPSHSSHHPLKVIQWKE